MVEEDTKQVILKNRELFMAGSMGRQSVSGALAGSIHGPVSGNLPALLGTSLDNPGDPD